MKTLFASFAILALCAVGTAAPQFFDARNDAMGGVGVASSRYQTAGFANPALLTKFKKGDRFAFILPSVGVRVADEDELIDAIADIQDEFDIAQAALASATITPAQLLSLANNLQGLNGRRVTGAAGVGFSFAIPSKSLGFALVAHSYVDTQAFTNIPALDITTIINASIAADLDSLTGEGVVLGAAVSEVGLALATEFSLANMSLSVGIVPKAQRIDTFNYSINVRNFDENDFTDSQFRNDVTKFNFDLGATLQVDDSLTLGIMARNLIEHDVQTVLTNNRILTYNIGPTITIGAAWSGDVITLAADIDVNDMERFKRNDDSQMLRLGAEFDAWNWVQLRAGFVTDLEDTVEDLFTAGVGLSPFDTFHIDIAGMASDKETYGAVVQLTFTF